MSKFPPVRASHILLSWDEAIESTHSRDLVFAVHDAKQIIAELRRGGYSWEQAVYEHSACPHSYYRDGDLGWFSLEDGVTPELYYAVRTIPKGELSEEPVQSPYGVHILTRTG